ncbi:uncharacterized protein LOC121677345 isoform X1 [Arvicola amphibius]|uniref:uncharacterized protein LOC121677345 isoform X1 n=1 Tax=Arvicola amphibius TaxID=1047088 RepID=UPI001C09BF7E|nr:uncharacterized protein LOC121677345 isoform X1 [Arvicola amphibius]
MKDLGAMSRLIMKNLPNGVEFCKSFGDQTKPRAWSKHAQKPNQPKQSSQDSIPSDTKKDDKKEKGAQCPGAGVPVTSPEEGPGGHVGKRCFVHRAPKSKDQASK